MKKLLSLLLAAALILTAPAAAFASGASPDYTELVIDAYTYTYSDEWGTYGFHIPKINRSGDGIAAVNDAIWQQLYEGCLAGEYGSLAAIANDWMPEPYDISYEWTVCGDVLSLVTMSDYNSDYIGYNVYNVSLSVGRRITDGELLDTLGVSQEGFYGQARQILSNTFEEMYDLFPEDEIKAEQRERNVSDANVYAVKPYLGAGGDLCMVADVSSLAGADQYPYELTVLDRGMLPDTISTTGLPKELPVDSRLTYFLDHCDSEYMTEADIAGFDKQMCNYARNGVYARSGRMFQTAEFQTYFEQFDWYQPSVAPEQFTESMLNDYQLKNIALVLAYETAHGY